MSPGRSIGDTEVIEPGETCPAGGVRVRWGVDDDGDGRLSDGEVDGSELHCDASMPPDRPPPILLRRDPQEPGGSCPYGGSAVHSGPDLDRDGVLDDEEIAATQYVCDDEEPVARSRVDRVPPGERCPYGGTVVHSGVDVDRDAALDDEEIAESAWFCSEAEESPEVEVAIDDNFSCARKANGTVWCWGDNGAHGRLGIDGFGWRLLPVPVPGLPGAVQISAGSDHACALDGEGGLWCWGDNDRGQLGESGTGGRARRVPGIPPLRLVRALAIATCGVDLDGDVWCWGSNWSGLAGSPPDGLYPHVFPPTRIEGVTGVTDLVGSFHACARDLDGAIWCWGSNAGAQIAAPASDTMPVTRIEGVPRAASVAAGSGNTCVVDDAGEATCWGRNGSWQLGDQDPDPRPRVIGGLGRVASVAIGTDASCALRDDGSVACWGGNTFGQFGDGSPARRSAEPVPIEGFFGVEQLAAGDIHVCAVRTGRAYCWGDNLGGEAARMVTAAPTQVLNRAREVSAGGAATCAVRLDGSPWCWGSLDIGADVDDTWLPRPTRLADWGDAIDVGAGRHHACFARADGSVWCVGENGSRQLGDGTTQSRMFLAPAGLDQVVAVESGGDYSCAIRDDKSLWCWGRLGWSLSNPVADPTELLADVREVAISRSHACALDRAGDVHCWGDNEQGQVGDGTFGRRAQPVLVQSGAVHVSVSSDDSCAILADGERWCWGQWFGRRPGPVDSPGANARMARDGGGDCLLDEGGRLRCVGRLAGDGSTEYRAGYVRAAVDGVARVSRQGNHTCALDDLGSIWCWGENDSAQIGDGSPARVVRRPVEVDF